MFRIFISLIIVSILLIPLSSYGIDTENKELSRFIDDFFQLRKIYIYDSFLLSLEHPLSNTKKYDILLARTVKKNDDILNRPQNPWFTMIAVIDMDAPVIKRINFKIIRPFRKSSVRVKDFDKDHREELMIQTIPYSSFMARDLVLVDSHNRVPVIRELKGLGFDEYIIRDIEKDGRDELINYYGKSHRINEKKFRLFSLNSLELKRIEAVKYSVESKISPVDDDFSTFPLIPFNKISGISHCVKGKKYYRGKDSFSFRYNLDYSKDDVRLRVFVNDDTPYFKDGKKSDSAVICFAPMYKKKSPLKIRVTPVKDKIRFNGVPHSLAGKYEKVRIRRIPYSKGWGFDIVIPVKVFEKYGISPADEFILFGIRINNVEGSFNRKYDISLSNNGKELKNRSELSIMKWKK